MVNGAAQDQKSRVMGIRFRVAGPVVYCEPTEPTLCIGDRVVVQTDAGLDLGWVTLPPEQVVHRDPMLPFFTMVRAATPDDCAERERLGEREEAALVDAKRTSRGLSLPMKFVYARYSLDGKRLLLEFSAESRVDFRLLLQKLRESLRVRIELRQVGPRDEAKAIGGLGTCGLELCCTKWMGKFDSVTMRMAKEQRLPISAEHLAGQCGRLKCCLRFEYQQYVEMNAVLPKVGEQVRTPDGIGRVVVGHPLKETVSVIIDATNDDDYRRTVEVPLAKLQRIEASTN
ncbi:MAG: regulatory iron-sulfur-containing complex subunit RicT [Chloroflexi bacterium]|nr:regulatory iron-sulfur-containing complex subunit RicT [Chloroflexota bacterium]